VKAYGVVRTLYGDVLARRREIESPHFYHGLLREVQISAGIGEQSDLTCVWGLDNYRHCLLSGLRHVVLMSEEPYGCPKRTAERVDYYKGLSPWGYNHFWHKWQAIRYGLSLYEAIVSVDWDCKQIGSLDQEWWERQGSYGVSFRATLIKQPNFTWAAKWRKRPPFVGKINPDDAKLVPFCGCFWTNSTELADECIGFSERVHFWMPEQALARWLDKTHGEKWIGVRAYKKLGYEPEFIKVVHQLQCPHRSKLIWRVDRHRRRK